MFVKTYPDPLTLLDGHDDLAIIIRFLYNDHIYSQNFTSKFENGGLEGQSDLARLKKGRVGGTFWSAFVPCPKSNNTDFSDAVYTECMTPFDPSLNLYTSVHGSAPADRFKLSVKPSSRLTCSVDSARLTLRLSHRPQPVERL